jgi:hypothetical protein
MWHLMAALTLEEVLDQICPKACGACGAGLPQPGAECPGCGELPALLRTEAAEQLAPPGALAVKQAELRRQEAERLRDAQIAALTEADQLVYLGQLQESAARAASGLTAAIARRDQAEAAVESPGRAETRAAGDLAAAVSAQQEFGLKLRKAERYKRDAATLVEARRKLELADDEVTARKAALAAATGAREQAEAALATADEEVGRLTRLRDGAAWRLAHPGEAGLSIKSMNALAVPVTAIANMIAPLRVGKPANQFTPQDLADDNRIAFVIGIAAQLGLLTGIISAEHTAGIRTGREQSEAEQARRPKVLGTTVFPPGSLPR